MIARASCHASSWLLQVFHAQQVPVDRLLARRGSNQRCWTGCQRRATPSLRGAWVCADLLKRGEDHRCGHRVVACVQQTWLHPWCMSRSTVDRLRAWSGACGQAAYTPSCSFSCSRRSFQTSACGQAASEERLQPAPVDRQPTESDSLAQGRTRTSDTRPQCNLANERLE